MCVIQFKLDGAIGLDSPKSVYGLIHIHSHIHM